METARVIKSYVDDEGFLVVDVETKSGKVAGLKVCGRPPVLGETVLVVDRRFVLSATKVPPQVSDPMGAEFLGSTPGYSSIESNPYGVEISSGGLNSILVTLINDLIKMTSRKIEIFNDGFSLETFYKSPGIAAVRLAGSCSVDLCRSEVYDWYFVVEDDTIKLEKWDRTSDKSSEQANLNRRKIRGFVHLKKDELVAEVINEFEKVYSRLRMIKDETTLEVVDQENDRKTVFTVRPDYYNFLTESEGKRTSVTYSQGTCRMEVENQSGRTTIDVRDGNVTVDTSKDVSIIANSGNGTVFVDGTLVVSKDIYDWNQTHGSLSTLRQIFNNHTHDENPEGTTSPPNQTVP